MAILTVDGVEYPNIHITKITRTGTVLDGPNTERTMKGEMVRDIIGTYYNYAIEVDSDDSDPAEYDAFYEVLTAPVDAHDIHIPYGQTMLDFRAYVSNAQDELLYVSRHNRWGNLTFNMIAMSPKRRPA